MPSCLKFLLILVVTAATVRGAETAAADPLREKIDRAIAKVKNRPLRADRDTPWVVMHAMIAFEQKISVLTAGADKPVPGLTYLCTQARHDGKRIFRNNNGLPDLPTRGFSYGMKKSFLIQDHVDQFLMAFADADVPATQKVKADDGTEFTVADMVTAAQKRFKPDQELGWTLVAATHYLGLDHTWVGADGKKYKVADVVALAVKRNSSRETEGGPHHLYGIAYALEAHRRAGGEVTGVWADAETYLKRHVRIARRFQLKDGSFSVMMFRRRMPARTPKLLVWATGHQIEWMTRALTAEQLTEPWMRRAVEKLADTLIAQDTESLSMGGLYHAAHALRRFREVTAPDVKKP
ncbi:MAG: hypothetical protein R3236_03110 [Phycisphaeraceae bacterium]|nr:hypothetical protein [Phycisphaeraceae bacterium]